MGLASFAPRLDDEGNSIQGVEMFARLSADLGLHLMASERRDVAQRLREFSGD
ncbi:glutaminase [Nesterenkonia alkaliphila]|uniref:glutaminase n=1 Tax=Nesterenkonia alkaliphila TaxID=1463631 RepID=UPI002F25EB94